MTFNRPYDIEYSNDCKYDSLRFQDGPFEFSPTLLILCGEGGSNKTIQSSTNYMRLTWITDDAIEGKGFHMSYKSILPLGEYIFSR